MNEPSQKSQPVTLDYVQQPKRRRWLSAAVIRLSQPMPVAWYYLITFSLGLIALVIILLMWLILSALH
jgi:hypothetical protein